MEIPGLDVIGGFSITSTPAQLRQQGTLDLAVKQSDHPPAAWLHSRCRPQTQLRLRFGGDFFCLPTPNSSTPLLLLAGGVGINPLFSILQHAAAIRPKPPPLALLFSAADEDELIFRVCLPGCSGRDSRK